MRGAPQQSDEADGGVHGLRTERASGPAPVALAQREQSPLRSRPNNARSGDQPIRRRHTPRSLRQSVPAKHLAAGERELDAGGVLELLLGVVDFSLRSLLLGATRHRPRRIGDAASGCARETACEYEEERDARKLFHFGDAGCLYVEERHDELGAPWDVVTADRGDEAIELRGLMVQRGAATAQVAFRGEVEQVGAVRADNGRAL